MTTPGEWATRADREGAVRLVESAWADGQIVEEERDRRVRDLGRAETRADVERAVAGLRAPSYEPVREARPPLRTLDERTIHPWRPGRAATALGAGALGIVLTLSVVVSIAAGGDHEVDAPVPVLTGRGYEEMVAAVRAETGRTEAFSAALHPAYAALDLPVDDTTDRMRSWYWDGELVENTRSTTEVERFDLRQVDMAVVLGLIADAQDGVEDATSWYALVHAPFSDGSMYQVYASNEHQETAYLAATADGTVLYRSDPST